MSAVTYPIHRALPQSMGTILRDKTHTQGCSKRCRCGYPIRYQWPDASGTNKPKVETGFTTDTEAFNRLQEIAEIKRRAKNGAGVEERGTPALEYITEHIKSRKRLAETTRQKYLYLAGTHLKKCDKFTISELLPRKMREIIADMRADHVNERDVSAIVSIVRAASKIAIADRLLEVDPTLGVETERSVQPAKDIPTQAQTKTMIAGATPLGRDLIAVACGTGMRIGEVLGLTRDCYHGTYLRIYRQWDGQKYKPLKARKAGEYRDIPLTPQVRGILQSRFADGEIAFPQVYKTKRRGRVYKPLGREVVTEEMNIARAAVKDYGAKFTFHGFRHFFASQCLAAGIDITEVGKWLGHTNIQITYLTYMHLIKPQFERMLDVMTGAMESIMPRGLEPVAA